MYRGHGCSCPPTSVAAQLARSSRQPQTLIDVTVQAAPFDGVPLIIEQVARWSLR
jgi:hypothetical protein